MLDEFAVEHAQVRLAAPAIDPKVAEHLTAEIEKGHVLFPMLGDVGIPRKNDFPHGQERFPVRIGLPVAEFFEHIHLTKITAIR